MARKHDTKAALLPEGWYPHDPGRCRAQIDRWLDAPARRDEASYAAAIVPHAGWYFSGELAARAIARLPEVDVIVLFGGHARARQPIDVVLEGVWETPLGDVPLASELAAELLAGEGGRAEGEAPDNSMEVLLPLLAGIHPGARLLALRPPMSEGAEQLGARVAQRLADAGLSAAAVGSTDLTHYGPNYGFVDRGPASMAQRWVMAENDRGFLDACLLRQASDAVRHAAQNRSACSAGAAAASIGFTAALAGRGALPTPRLLAHTCSYEKRPADSFVGYGALLL